MKTSDTMPCVLIMMATYNSEEFICKQIDSIRGQTYKNWSLVIQDDMSTDNTQAIIRDYCKQDSRISLMINDSKNHGPFINFHILLQNAKRNLEADFYMLSDHDDVWNNNKIEKMLEFYNKKYQSTQIPVLIYGDMTIIDAQGKQIYASLNSKSGIEYKNKITTFFAHKVYGCNTLFNKSLLNRIPDLDISDPRSKSFSHDNMLAKLAALYGDVSYMPVSLMEYRRYASNVTAKQSYSLGLGRILTRVFGIQELAKDHALTYRQSLYLIALIDNNTDEQRETLNNVQAGINEGGVKLFWFLLKNRVSWGKSVKTISHLIIILSGQYKKYL
ncbi:glycosyltransferase [Lactiplantibacillus herbarum]|uniref:glycosyltransferase n=1 Tax=Lactiplantibacillus herbarum TaxID=1670446 RepID=UPI00069F385C|nr:glycosyltransferase [Lactiplantibacillus herbarum]